MTVNEKSVCVCVCFGRERKNAECEHIEQKIEQQEAKKVNNNSEQNDLLATHNANANPNAAAVGGQREESRKVQGKSFRKKRLPREHQKLSRLRTNLSSLCLVAFVARFCLQAARVMFALSLAAAAAAAFHISLRCRRINLSRFCSFFNVSSLLRHQNQIV